MESSQEEMYRSTTEPSYIEMYGPGEPPSQEEMYRSATEPSYTDMYGLSYESGMD